MKQVSKNVSSKVNPSPLVNESGEQEKRPSDLSEMAVDGNNDKSSSLPNEDEALVSPPQCIGIKVINFLSFLSWVCCILIYNLSKHVWFFCFVRFMDFVLESGQIAEKSKVLPPLARSKKRCTKSNSKSAWGKLISQSSEVYF